jgi:hypothetical protein
VPRYGCCIRGILVAGGHTAGKGRPREGPEGGPGREAQGGRPREGGPGREDPSRRAAVMLRHVVAAGVSAEL